MKIEVEVSESMSNFDYRYKILLIIENNNVIVQKMDDLTIDNLADLAKKIIDILR